MAKLPRVTTTLGVDQRQLFFEVGPARLDLVGEGVAVAGRAALDRIGDVEFSLVRPISSSTRRSRSWPERPTKGRPWRSSCSPGPFPDEHEVGLRVPHPEHDIRPACRETATRAGRTLPWRARTGRLMRTALGLRAQGSSRRRPAPRRRVSPGASPSLPDHLLGDGLVQRDDHYRGAPVGGATEVEVDDVDAGAGQGRGDQGDHADPVVVAHDEQVGGERAARSRARRGARSSARPWRTGSRPTVRAAAPDARRG